MKRMRFIKAYSCMKQTFLLLVTFGVIFMSVGCGEVDLDSSWKDREIIIDGMSDDWMDTLYYFDGDKVSVGFFNDNEHLYICLLADDYSLRRQVIMQGFTLWLDPAGGKERTFGIKFPLGMMAVHGEKMPEEMSEGRPDREMMGREGREQPDPERIRKAFEQTLDELEILGPGEDDRERRIIVEEAEGLQIKVRNETGLLVYELQIPLRSMGENAYAVGASPGALIGLGLEVQKPDVGEMRNGMKGRGGGGRPGSMPPGGGRPGGISGGMGERGGMGMRGGRMPRMPDGLKLWIKLRLASRGDS